MGSQNKLSWIGALALATTSFTAQAADILPEPPIIEQPPIIEIPPEVVTKTGGWYLRGDISYDKFHNFDVTYGANSFAAANLANGYNVGLGVGYQFNDMFRADITVERLWSDFSGFTTGTCAFDAGGNSVIGTCRSDDTAKFSAWSAMVNGYFDVGHFSGFTPYVGAGVGASYVKFDSYTSNGTCTLANNTQDCYQVGNANYYNPNPGDSLVSTSRTTYNTNASWKFTYALMAGVSYEFTHNLKVDAGYKYMSIGAGTIIDDIGGGVSVDHSALGVHAVRVGLRYQVW